MPTHASRYYFAEMVDELKTGESWPRTIGTGRTASVYSKPIIAMTRYEVPYQGVLWVVDGFDSRLH